MHHLESKISDLQNQYQLLLKERQQDITVIITTLDLTSLEDPLLIGGLLFIKKKVTEKDPILEAWRDAGETFLRRSKPKTRPREGEKQMGNFSRPHEHEDGKQAESPKIPSGKNTPSKQTPSPQAIHQPPQKQSQSREE